MGLPIGYTKAEYIKTSGGQYIDTGFIPNNKTKIEVKFMWDGGTNGYLYGAVDSNNAKSVTSTLSTTGGNWRFDGTLYQFKAVANTLYTAVMDSSGVAINGTLNKYAGTVSTFTSPNTLFICSGHNATGPSTSYFVGKMYYFKIYDDGTLVRDFVPCVNAEEVAGLYDLVNNVFYPSASDTAFSASGFASLPNGYTRVEYIQSGGAQYIDTGFKPNQNTRVVIDMQCINVTTTSHVYFGSRTGQSSNSFCFWGYAIDAPRSDYGSTTHQTFTVSEATDRITIDKNKNVASYGTNQLTHTTNTFQGTYNLYLFCLNNAGTASQFSSMRVFSCKIYDNGTLVRDFVPCKAEGDVVGLYDLVNGVFYVNKGTGTFTAGSNLSPNYKIVDATALNSAMTATADVIRSKREDSELISWSFSTGFADAIQSIKTGTKLAVGTIDNPRTGDSYYIQDSPVTISGLGFQPVRVIIFAASAMDNCGLITADTASKKRIVYYEVESEYEDEETGETYYESSYYVESFDFLYSSSSSYGLFVSFEQDGFSISANTYGSYDDLRWMPSTAYNYIAIGE